MDIKYFVATASYIDPKPEHIEWSVSFQCLEDAITHAAGYFLDLTHIYAVVDNKYIYDVEYATPQHITGFKSCKILDNGVYVTYTFSLHDLENHHTEYYKYAQATVEELKDL